MGYVSSTIQQGNLFPQGWRSQALSLYTFVVELVFILQEICGCFVVAFTL